MKRYEEIAVPAITATTAMTLFSYLLSELSKEDFSEPRHLSVMLQRLAPGMSKSWARVGGWGTHYAVGVLFVAVYIELWESEKVKASLLSGIALGVLCGSIAVLVWKATFKPIPCRPG